MSHLNFNENIWIEILSYLGYFNKYYKILREAKFIPIIYYTNCRISYSKILFKKNYSLWNFRYHIEPIPLEFNDFSSPHLIENNYKSEIKDSKEIIDYSIEESIEPSVEINSSEYRKKVYKKGGRFKSRKNKKNKKIKKKKKEENDKFLKKKVRYRKFKNKKKVRNKKRNNERNNRNFFDINLPNEIGKVYFYKGDIYCDCYYESSYVYFGSSYEDSESYYENYDFDMSPDEYESYLSDQKMDRAKYRRRRARRYR